MEEFDLISLGDASVDSFITPSESDILCTLDTKECKVCFSYGDKIPVKDLVFTVGGNAANLAVGATRLGVKTTIALTLGDDSLGYQIVDKLTAEKVNLDFVVQQPSTRSNYSTAINYSGE